MSEAVKLAKEQKEENQIVMLSTGVRAILHSVSASLMQEVTSRIKEPKVPIIFNDEKGRKEEDPFDETYLQELAEVQHKRARASLDAMALFGIELVDGLPEDNKWIKKLQQLERLGYLDLSEFNLEDELDQEFVFKRYIALGSADLVRIGRMTGIRQEDIETAEDTFQRS